MYKRVLLKLSGEALGNDNEVFDPAMLDKIYGMVQLLLLPAL